MVADGDVALDDHLGTDPGIRSNRDISHQNRRRMDVRFGIDVVGKGCVACQQSDDRQIQRNSMFESHA